MMDGPCGICSVFSGIVIWISDSADFDSRLAFPMLSLNPGRVAHAPRGPLHAALLIFVLFLSCLGIRPVVAATYYVRTDGGNASQCDGLSNVRYPGSGTGHSCAWSHPFIALPPTFDWRPVAARLHGGDTLIIGPGSYMMGVGAPGAEACTADTAYSCRMQNIPGGPSAQQPTRILGQGYQTGCAAPPTLWGTESSYSLLQITGKQGGAQNSNIEVGCLELTDHSSCIYQHCNLGGCKQEQTAVCKTHSDGPAPWGSWARFGIDAADAANVHLHDLNIHGLAGEGVRGGRLTDWTIDRVRIYANGFAGWDNDIGMGTADTSNHGTTLFRNVEIAYNGCGERYPSGEIFGCWDQSKGGYGDGLGAGHTGGNWVVEDSYVHDNVSDGLDLLYATESANVTYRRVKAERNAGNQLKAGGNTLIEDSVVVSTCAEPWAEFPTNNYPNSVNSSDFIGRYNMSLGGTCRANGDSISLRPQPNSQVTVRGNTITGQGGCQITWTIDPAYRHDTSAHLLIANNAFIGGNNDWLYAATGGGHRLTCGTYAYQTDITGDIRNNVYWNIRNLDVNHCPPGNSCGRDAAHNSSGAYCSSTELCATGGADPQLVDSGLLTFNAMLRETSPLINAGNSANGTATDFRLKPRPALGGYDIGAIEYQGAEAEQNIFVSGFDSQG